MNWTALERRWRDALMAAMLPRVEGVDLPGYAELDHAAFWQRFYAVAPPLLRFGLRVAVWVITWWPLFTLRAARPLHRLERSERDDVLTSLGASRWYLVRQLVTTVKMVGCFAYFNNDAGRAAVLTVESP